MPKILLIRLITGTNSMFFEHDTETSGSINAENVSTN